MVPVCSSVMLELVLAVHSYHVIAYPDVRAISIVIDKFHSLLMNDPCFMLSPF